MLVMSNLELAGSLKRLSLSEAESARVLSVNPRTVRRWVEGSTVVPGAVEQALQAWLRLESLRVPWRPEGVPIWEEDQTKLLCDHSKELSQLIQKVENRGGPAAPWEVDLDRRKASLGPIEVRFHVLINESFSPSWYSRRDGPSDLKRDWRLLEDAFYCIAKAISRAGKGWSERE
jgi:hypothetical protein